MSVSVPCGGGDASADLFYVEYDLGHARSADDDR